MLGIWLHLRMYIMIWIIHLAFDYAQGQNKSVNYVVYLFDRPGEPTFLPKGDEKVGFQLPSEYYTKRYAPMEAEITNRFGGDVVSVEVPIKKVDLPDLSKIQKLGRREAFSLFLPFHRKLASSLIEIFMSRKSYDDFLSVAVYCRDRINPYLFIYALSVAIIHRPDTKNVELPSLLSSFPDKYVGHDLISRMREEASVVSPGSRMPLEVPRDFTGTDLDPEHRLAYFREDPGVNLHHWHWHLVYPFDAAREIVAKDRRGELFYYLHQQIIARYNFERLSNGLSRVRRFVNWREPIPEGYFPKLDNLVASRNWPPRPSGMRLSDINREMDQIKFDIEDLERWRDRLYDAIHQGVLVNDQGGPVSLNDFDGIDILGNIIESSILSINRNRYGDLHNLGHVAIALIHDPDGRFLEPFGVMGDTATAMRDPIFYRWHAFIDDLFQEYKSTQPRYSVAELDFDGVEVLGMELETQGAPRNEFATYWQQSDLDMSRGLDFAPRGPLFARFTLLQHRPFVYKIMVDNKAPMPRQGTVRIFLAPKFDERGNPFLIKDQRTLYIEMDKFVVNLVPGRNQVIRRSDQSSVTIPFEATYRNLDRNRPQGGRQLGEFNMCGCGWPQNVLVPRGNERGLDAELFIMISDYQVDRVDQPTDGNACRKAHSYCGFAFQRYPDSRHMGFPFDRVPRDGVFTLRDFMTRNMGVLDVKIRHNNQVLASVSNSQRG